MAKRLMGVTSLLLVCSIELSIGTPVIDYPNDSYNSSNENYIDLDAHVKETVVRRNPKFVSTSKTIIVNEGDPIKLPCQVDVLEDFIIIWKKGSSILALG